MTGTALATRGPFRIRASRRRLGTLTGLAVLVAVVFVVGPVAVGRALGSLDLPTLALATAIAGVSTTCAAWRWQLVSRRLGMPLSLPGAVAECYRAQLLNSVLPGGIVGDANRAVRQGRSADDVTCGLRAVAWERSCGQLVLAACAAPVLVTTRSGLRWPQAPPWVTVVAVVGVAGVILAGVGGGGGPAGRAAHRLAAVVGTDARALLTPATALGVATASLVVLAAHVATFVLAARAVGVAPQPRLVGVALMVLLVGGVPLNIAGWGPREGAAAWAFAGAGLGASTGLAAAVAYGAVALVATLPGLGVVAVRAARSPRAPESPESPGSPLPVGSAPVVADRLGEPSRV